MVCLVSRVSYLMYGFLEHIYIRTQASSALCENMAPSLCNAALVVALIHVLALAAAAAAAAEPRARYLRAGRSSSKNAAKGGSPVPPPPALPAGDDVGYQNKIFDVLTYGAKGDGVTDDTQAFLAAWAQACKVESAIVEVPAEFTFLLRPVLFSGPCQYDLVFQIDGTIVAPTNVNAWNGASLLQWIEFAKVHNMILQGSGTGLIDGNGPAWWDSSCKAQGQKTSKSCDIPTAVRFYASNNVTVQNLGIANSPQTHLKFDSCQVVQVNNVSISSPAASPNTDGIHLQDTRGATIQNSVVAAGDDCVSIQTGCSDIEIFDMMCGPGHGISIGGLGRSGAKACVSNVSVHDVVVQNSQNGVRIKTWQGGSGSVNKVSFHNVSIVNVSNPIVIDQFYCDGKLCRNQTKGVSISEVSYKNIKGTYTQKNSIHFACSDDVPCVGIVVADIELVSVKGYDVPAFCWSSYGEMHSPTNPLVTCLQQGKPKLGQVQSSSEEC